MYSLIIRMKLWRRIFTRRELIMLQKMVLNSIPQVKLDLKLFTMMNREKNSEFLSSASIVSNKTKFQFKLFICKFKIELNVILSLLTTSVIACSF